MSSDAAEKPATGAWQDVDSHSPRIKFARTSWLTSIATLLLLSGVLTAWKWDTLHLPPYEDQTVGLWAEAAFLVESGFDYYALAFDVNDFTDADPGPRSYLISILPTLLALMMLTLPDAHAVIVVAHLATFAVTAGILMVVHGIARTFVHAWMATLLVAALALTPLFSVQIEMVGMDIPMTCFAILAARAAWESRFYWAAAWGNLAFLTKTTGGVVTGGISCFLLAMLLFDRWRGRGWRQSPYLAGLLLNGSLLLVEYVFARTVDSTLEGLFGIEWPSILRVPGAVYLCPDVVGIVLVVGGLSTVCLLHFFFAQFRTAADKESGRVPLEIQVLVLGWSIIGGILWTCTWGIAIPRYYTMGLPFLYLAFAATHVLFRWFPASQGVLLGFLVLFHGLNQYGRFFPDFQVAARQTFETNPHVEARSCVFLERSREYLADHLSNIDAIRKIATERPDATYLLTLPHLWYLTNARYGYVERPLETRHAATFHAVADAFLDVDPEQGPILFWARSGKLFLPPPDRTRDEILYEGGGPTPIVVYRKRWSPPLPKDRDAVSQRLFEETRQGSWSDWRAAGQFPYWVAAGQLDRAQELLERELKTKPDNPLLRSLQALLVVLQQSPTGDPRRRQRLQEALPFLSRDPFLASGLATLRAGKSLSLFDNLPMESPERLASWNRPHLPPAYNLAVHALREGRYLEATEYLQETLRSGGPKETIALTHFALACLTLEESRNAKAETHLVAAIEAAKSLGKDFPEADVLRGTLAIQQSSNQQAVVLLRTAAEKLGSAPLVHYLWGIAEIRMGHRSAAESQWLRSESLSERAIEPRDALETLDRLPTQPHCTTDAKGDPSSPRVPDRSEHKGSTP